MYRLAIIAACTAMSVMAQKIIILPSLIAVFGQEDEDEPVTPQKIIIRPSGSAPATETESFALQSGNKLRVSNPNGDIKISVWDKDEVALTANFKPGNDGKQVLIEAKNNEKSLKLTVKHPRKKIWRLTRRETRRASCEIELMVPRQIVSNISSDNGLIVLNATDGQNKVETKNGAIVLNTITGKNKLKTTNGNISLNSINGSVDIFTPNGSISGSVQNAEILKVFTHTGNIRVKLLDLNCTIVASAAPGEVTLQPSGTKNFEYEKGKTIRATFGNGSASINLRTLAGSIVIE